MHNDLLIYVHIPRTAGTTLRTIFERIYQHHSIVQVYGGDIPQPWSTCGRYSEARWQRIRLVRGHMAYGIHEWIPRKDIRYFTIIREPVDRVISTYYYILNSRHHNLHDEAEKMGLVQFMTSGVTAELNNGQVRQLCGIAGAGLPQGPWQMPKVGLGECTVEMLEAAKAALETFAVVGLTHRFDESLARMREAFGWPVLKHRRMNATRRPMRDELPDSVLKEIADWNWLDVQLFEWAERQFWGKGKA